MFDSRGVLTILPWDSVCMVFVFEMFATDFEQDPCVTDVHVAHSPTLRVTLELQLHAWHWEGSPDKQDQQSTHPQSKEETTVTTIQCCQRVENVSQKIK